MLIVSEGRNDKRELDLMTPFVADSEFEGTISQLAKALLLTNYCKILKVIISDKTLWPPIVGKIEDQ